jgi:hypothetical protein
MCELNNQFPAKNGTDFIGYWADSLPDGGLAKLLKDEKTFSMPIIIRQFGSIDGGIGLTDETRTIEGFLRHQIKERMPSPWCQLQELDDKEIPWKELLQEFEKHPRDRKYTAASLGTSYMNDRTIIDGLRRPKFLEEDLFRYMGVDMKDADKQWDGDARVVPEQGFCLVSMEGSYTLPHFDCYPSWVVNNGFKIWGFANGAENIELRKTWTVSDGLSKFLDWRFVLLYPGDLLIMRQCLHTVYSPSDGLTWGGHEIDGQTADGMMEMATEILQNDVLTNQVPKQMKNHTRNLLKVSHGWK